MVVIRQTSDKRRWNSPVLFLLSKEVSEMKVFFRFRASAGENR